MYSLVFSFFHYVPHIMYYVTNIYIRQKIIVVVFLCCSQAMGLPLVCVQLYALMYLFLPFNCGKYTQYSYMYTVLP